MENFALIALAESLKSAMDDVIIRRVVQYQPNGFILQTRSARLPALKIQMNAQNPAIYPSESKPPIDSPNSDFLMVLRKHFTSAELIEFRKPLSERAIEMVFKTAVPSRELETMTLVLELIPNAPNIVVLDAERRVLSSFSAITPQHGIGAFDPYTFPSTGSKIDLDRVLAEEVPELEEAKDREWLMSTVAGLGPVFADEILFRAKQTGSSVTAQIREILEQLRAPVQESTGGWIYTEKPLTHILEQNDIRAFGKAIISPIALRSLERSHSCRTFGKITEAAKFYFDELEIRVLLDHAKLPLLRDLRTAAKRLSEREKRLVREQKKYEHAEENQKTAQMLTSSGKKPDQRYESVTVTDYFQDKPREVTVKLNPALTLRENIEKMFKLHAKAGRGRQIVARQISVVQARIAAIAEQVRRLQAIKDWDTWLAIENRIAREQTIAGGEAQKTEPIRVKRFRSVSIDGREILIGRSSRENDELTFHVAAPDDFWFHVATYSGSHVIVRNPSRESDLPEPVLLKAAQLAAFFSQARNSSKVEVHFTRRKHVTKPRRAKPGLVRLNEFKSLSVEPRNWLEE